MEIVDILGDLHTIDVVPGAETDTVARIDGRRAAIGMGTEISAPGFAARTCGFCQLLTVRIGSGESTEVAPLPEPTLVMKKLISFC